MASSSGANTSSALSRRPSSYDVFINFRGVDTRDNFVWLLYEALRRAGIHAFIDSEELWEGEEIRPSLLRAIQRSKISIPVFSEHYADSKYCLLELAQIWECHLSDGQTILPIFIGVEPKQVRHHKGSFQEPLEKHKRRGEPVETWKNALTKVADLKGWSLEVKGDANIKEQSDKVELVVQRALRELGTTPLDEPKNLIGIDSHVDELLCLLHIGSNDIRFVGICGMGGLGKTTMAKAVYNRIFGNFDRRSFLTDVREQASQGNKGLVSLQKQLLRDMFDRNYDIGIVSRGSKLIAERLDGEKILLILDDVDDHEQLDALVGGLNWFGQGSRVIITTRDVHCLSVHEGKFGKQIQIYMPAALNFENSLLLFSLHAFSKKEPPEKYKQLSLVVVQYADGLPLALEVLGTFLNDKDKKEWEDTVKRLESIVNDKMVGKSIKDYDDKVFEKLMISYNQLGDQEKTIFLDVAGYFSKFKDWDIEEIIPIWDAYELGPRLAIKELIQKHLLKSAVYGDCAYERLKIHDQLLYMGRRIILKDSHGDPTKCSRLWSPDEIWKILREDTRTHMVEGIFLSRNEESKTQDILSWEDFQRMPNLRFLQIDGIERLNGDFAHLPSKLRWFHWCCEWIVIPPNFYHPVLVHLKLSCDYLNCRNWSDPPQHKNKCFQNLKRLDIRLCWENSFSRHFFPWFPSIQKLYVHFLCYLSELPDTICLIASLRTLSLSDCYSLKKLPTSIGDLRNLVELYVTKASIEELPDSVGQLEKLEELDVSGCHKLVKLPTSMGRMRSLLHFDLRGTLIEKFPDDFSKLSSLEVLTMGAYYQSNNALESLPELPSNLIRLVCYDCISLVNLPDLSQLKSLREVDLTGCKNLEDIHGLEGTESLEDLKLLDCHNLTKLADFSKLKNLRKLDIANRKNLEEMHGLEETEYLEKLPAKGCYKLRELPDLSKLKNLQKLNVSDCENLMEIQCLQGIESLEELAVQRCYKLTKTRRKILGKGTLLHDVGQGQLGSKSSVADDELYHWSPILCLVFTLLFRKNERGQTVDFHLEALIHWGIKETTCRFSVRLIEDINVTRRDIIYIHHFNGFPFDSKGAIEKLEVKCGQPSDVEVKFWKLLFENKDSGQQLLNQQYSAMLVAEVFRWLDADDEKEEALHQIIIYPDWSVVGQRKRCWSPNSRAHLLDNEDEA